LRVIGPKERKALVAVTAIVPNVHRDQFTEVVNVKFKKVPQSRLMLSAGPDQFETCGHAPELTSKPYFRAAHRQTRNLRFGRV
jgi:hypothetical protein